MTSISEGCASIAHKVLSHCLAELLSHVTMKRAKETWPSVQFSRVPTFRVGSSKGKKMKVSGIQKRDSSYKREESLREEYLIDSGRKDFTVITKGKQTTFT